MPRKKKESTEEKEFRVKAKIVFLGAVIVLITIMAIVMQLREKGLLDGPKVDQSQVDASKKVGEKSNENGFGGKVMGAVSKLQNMDYSKDGLKKEAQDFAHNSSDTIADSMGNAPENVAKSSEKVVQNSQKFIEKKVTNKVSDIVFETIIQPIIEKVVSLPQEQQDEIKAQICK